MLVQMLDLLERKTATGELPLAGIVRPAVEQMQKPDGPGTSENGGSEPRCDHRGLPVLVQMPGNKWCAEYEWGE